MDYLDACYLVVDDNETTLDLLKASLSKVGVRGQVYLAKDGTEACQILTNFAKGKLKIDFVICDMVMPMLDGLDVLEFVRRDPVLKDLPFLMLTAENNRNVVTQCIKAGVSHYLLKPWKLEDLQKKLGICWAKH